MKPPDDSGSPGIIAPHGGYEDLKSFQMAELVFDGTVVFCDRFIDRRSRTHDQMVQAARSGYLFLTSRRTRETNTAAFRG